MQSFSELCYIFRRWEHFQITKFIEFIWLEGKLSLALQQLFPIQSLLIFLRFELPPEFHSPMLQTSNLSAILQFLYFPVLSISSFKFKSGYLVT